MTLSPFDIRTILMEKHAQHVVLIHFPIALFMTGVLLDFLAQWSRRETLATAAYINLALAALATLPTVATGLLAWQWALEGQKLKGILLYHLIAGLTSSVFIIIVWLMHYRARTAVTLKLPASRLLVELLAVALVGLTGHLGGILSGVNI